MPAQPGTRISSVGEYRDPGQWCGGVCAIRANDGLLKNSPVSITKYAGVRALPAAQKEVVKDRRSGRYRHMSRDLSLLPRLDLALHRLEVTLDAVYSDGEGINQVEALGLLGQDRRV